MHLCTLSRRSSIVCSTLLLVLLSCFQLLLAKVTFKEIPGFNVVRDQRPVMLLVGPIDGGGAEIFRLLVQKSYEKAPNETVALSANVLGQKATFIFGPPLPTSHLRQKIFFTPLIYDVIEEFGKLDKVLLTFPWRNLVSDEFCLRPVRDIVKRTTQSELVLVMPAQKRSPDSSELEAITSQLSYLRIPFQFARTDFERMQCLMQAFRMESVELQWSWAPGSQEVNDSVVLLFFGLIGYHKTQILNMIARKASSIDVDVFPSENTNQVVAFSCHFGEKAVTLVDMPDIEQNILLGCSEVLMEKTVSLVIEKLGYISRFIYLVDPHDVPAPSFELVKVAWDANNFDYAMQKYGLQDMLTIMMVAYHEESVCPDEVLTCMKQYSSTLPPVEVTSTLVLEEITEYISSIMPPSLQPKNRVLRKIIPLASSLLQPRKRYISAVVLKILDELSFVACASGIPLIALTPHIWPFFWAPIIISGFLTPYFGKRINYSRRCQIAEEFTRGSFGELPHLLAEKH